MVQLVYVMLHTGYTSPAFGFACRSDEQGKMCEQAGHSPNTLSHSHENTAFKSMWHYWDMIINSNYRIIFF